MGGEEAGHAKEVSQELILGPAEEKTDKQKVEQRGFYSRHLRGAKASRQKHTPGKPGTERFLSLRFLSELCEREVTG